ncbi:MAG: YedE-related selenium metabolism membrane protein [Planctomycetes bacterium]|nr:YedE-related selenium metabolism membrane protein [Planctomycetota bacterium]
MLRRDTTPPLAFALIAAVGIGAALLVANGNPGNMGICGACFLRDDAGALGLFSEPAKLPIFRPEGLGIVFGALAAVGFRKKFAARSGSYAVTRLVLGVWTAIGALVFLGCPFRMLQRIGGGDLNAVVGLLGLLAGVGVAVAFEKRGYNVGKTQVVPAPVGLAGPIMLLVAAGLWFGGNLAGPGPGGDGPPAHAPWMLALAIAAGAGAVLQMTGFCAISACRQVFIAKKTMLIAAAALVLAYAATSLGTGKFNLGFDGQPAAHGEHLWNFLAMVLVGLCGAFAGGCPVRQLVMTGEGNGDGFVTVIGLLLGGALAHTLGLASSGKGATEGGMWAVAIGIGCVLVYAAFTTRAHRAAA